MNRIAQSWGEVTSVIRFQDSDFCFASSLYEWFWWNMLPFWGDSYGKELGGQPLANRRLVPETLSPTVLKELNPVNKYIDELGSGSFLSETFGVFPGQVQHLNYTLVRDDELKS